MKKVLILTSYWLLFSTARAEEPVESFLTELRAIISVSVQQEENIRRNFDHIRNQLNRINVEDYRNSENSVKSGTHRWTPTSTLNEVSVHWSLMMIPSLLGMDVPFNPDSSVIYRTAAALGIGIGRKKNVYGQTAPILQISLAAGLGLAMGLFAGKVHRVNEEGEKLNPGLGIRDFVGSFALGVGGEHTMQLDPRKDNRESTKWGIGLTLTFLMNIFKIQIPLGRWSKQRRVDLLLENLHRAAEEIILAIPDPDPLLLSKRIDYFAKALVVLGNELSDHKRRKGSQRDMTMESSPKSVKGIRGESCVQALSLLLQRMPVAK